MLPLYLESLYIANILYVEKHKTVNKIIMCLSLLREKHDTHK